MLVKNVRLAFPTLWNPEQVQGQGKPAYSAVLLIDKDDPQLDEINAELERVALEKWEAKAAAVLKSLRLNHKIALRDGELKADQYDGYAGCMSLNGRNLIKPMVLDRDGKTELTESDGKVYAGCYVNAIIDFWAQDNQYGQRINSTLHKVQYYKEGDAFAGGSMSDEEFEDLADDLAEEETEDMKDLV